MSVSQQIRKIIDPLHKRYRTQKLNFFLYTLRPGPEETLLDVGGGVGVVGEFEPLYKYFRSVQIVNLDAKHINVEDHAHVIVSNADGCALPYANKSFDWVFSNAVIEHVGGASRAGDTSWPLQTAISQWIPTHCFPSISFLARNCSARSAGFLLAT
jgi:2-polyprenyl-3-methyl-5-hydroxy-6-metoxy-1,4-benzoquinol methylase